MTEIVLRLLVILLIGCFVWVVRYKGKKQSVQFVLVYCAFVLFSGTISWKIVDLLPVPTENVVVTALGERNESAKNDEIYLTKISVDGKEVKLKTATDDRWFWQKNWYIWRNDDSLSRPKELSHSFVLSLPIGRDRYIDFYANKYKGIAEIDYEGQSQIVDCYSEEDDIRRVYINNTKQLRILLYMMLQFVTFIALYLGLHIFIKAIIKGKLEEMLVRKWDSIILLFLSASALYILFQIFPSSDHFYFDHVVTLGAALSDNLEGVWDFLMQHTSVPPLPLFIEYFYYKVVPFGYNQIFLLPTICASLSVYLTGKFVSKYSNKVIGITAAVLTVCSVTFMEHGKDIRHYSFSILMTVLVVFSFVNYRYAPNKKNIILYAVSMLMSALCNYHSFILLLGIFLFDMILNYKHFRFKSLVPYCIAGTAFLPWAIIISLRLIRLIGSWRNSSTWHAALSFGFLRSLIYYISGENLFLVLLVALSLPVVVNWTRKKMAFSDENFIYSLSAYLLIFFFAIVFLWALLNPGNTLLNNRYFSVVIPLVSITQCIVFHESAKYITASKTTVQYMLPLVILVGAFPYMIFHIMEKQNLSSYGWLFCSNVITSDKEAYFQTSCVYTYVDVLKHKSFTKEKRRALEYLLQKDRKQYPINYEILTKDNIDNIENYHKIYIIDLPEEEVGAITDKGFKMELQKGKLSIFTEKS